MFRHLCADASKLLNNERFARIGEFCPETAKRI